MAAYWRCIFNWRNTAVNIFAQNCLFFEDASETKTPEQIGAILDDVWWGTTTGNDTLRNYTSGNVRLETITLQRIAPAPPQGSIPYVTQQRAGSQGTSVKHPVLGMVFTLKDGLAGRKHRGRMYHFGAVPSHLTDSGPSTTIQGPTAIPLLFDRWLNQFGPLPVSGISWVIFHREEVGDARFTRVTSIQLNQRCCVQRRRNFGVGI